jgi:hypothetical protein
MSMECLRNDAVVFASALCSLDQCDKNPSIKSEAGAISLQPLFCAHVALYLSGKPAGAESSTVEGLTK